MTLEKKGALYRYMPTTFRRGNGEEVLSTGDLLVCQHNDNPGVSSWFAREGDGLRVGVYWENVMLVIRNAEVDE